MNGHDAIDYLASKLKIDDPKSSSYWNHYHSKFNYKDGEFTGIEGFGSNRKTFSGIRKIAHRLLQSPYRAISKKVIFSNYPWHLTRELLQDELCPWNLKYYDLIPPFYHPYDGPIRHRLVKF